MFFCSFNFLQIMIIAIQNPSLPVLMSGPSGMFLLAASSTPAPILCHIFILLCSSVIFLLYAIYYQLCCRESFLFFLLLRVLNLVLVGSYLQGNLLMSSDMTLFLVNDNFSFGLVLKHAHQCRKHFSFLTCDHSGVSAESVGAQGVLSTLAGPELSTSQHCTTLDQFLLCFLLSALNAHRILPCLQLHSCQKTYSKSPHRFLMFSSVLHFYCWVTNYHQFSSLKNTRLLVHSSVVQEIRYKVAGFSPQSLLRLKSKGFDRATFLSGSSGEESTSKHNHIVGRIQFFATKKLAAGLRSLFPCWLSARDPSAARSCPYSLSCTHNRHFTT